MTVSGGGSDQDKLNGDAGNDLIYGDWGLDTIYGGTGNDTLIGGQNSDILVGGDGDDVIYGDEVSLIGDTLYWADTLYGDKGKDTIFGGTGDDFVYGGSGDDKLFGGDGSDVVGGDEGSDELWGGAGSDRFFFSKTSGNDLVKDFEKGVDKIWMDGFGEFSAVRSSVNGSGNIVIYVDGLNFFVEFVGITKLTQGDFIFT